MEENIPSFLPDSPNLASVGYSPWPSYDNPGTPLLNQTPLTPGDSQQHLNNSEIASCDPMFQIVDEEKQGYVHPFLTSLACSICLIFTYVQGIGMSVTGSYREN